MEHILKRLEFNKIKKVLAQYAASSLGVEAVEALQPQTSLEEVSILQQETSEVRKLISNFGDIPRGGIHDIRPLLAKTRIDGVLEVYELVDIAATLVAARRIKRFVVDKDMAFPLLKEQVVDLSVIKELEDKINRAVNDRGEIADHASTTLQQVRSRIKSGHIRVKEQLQHMIRSQAYKDYLQDMLVTIRDDRYVVPVKAAYRAQFPGIVHDASASGATVFMEPTVVVELNNQLKQWALEEKQEVLRILKVLSREVASHDDDLTQNMKILAKIDFMTAKALLSLEWHGVEPRLNERGYIHIKKGRHPLLGEKAVPIDVALGKEFHTMVITGPNTGGKTVTLKTLGLFTLMAQAGLHLPADEDTEAAVFDHVFCDIGDEQSIEQSLSTFSAHMVHIVDILKSAHGNVLVLLDELGAGTDPTEGAALAMAILEELHERQVRTAATTHYSELKTFAYTREGIMNASVEFDVKTLRPTYRLLVGTPGKSNAFAISNRLGLEDKMIERAKAFLTQESLKIEDLLHQIEENRNALIKEREENNEKKAQLDQSRSELQQARQEAEREKDQMLQKAYDEAEQMIARAQQEMEGMLGQLREAAREKKVAEGEKAGHQLRQKIKQQRQSVRQKREKHRPSPAKPVNAQKLCVGDAVMLTHLNQKGYVIQPPGDTGETIVQVGIMKVTVKAAQLKKLEEAVEIRPVNRKKQVDLQKSKEMSSELLLLGKTVEEACEAIDKYLDDAYMISLERVRIVHGKGTGALRRGVQEYLRTHPMVKSFHGAEPREGGFGVTIVDVVRK